MPSISSDRWDGEEETYRTPRALSLPAPCLLTLLPNFACPHCTVRGTGLGETGLGTRTRTRLIPPPLVLFLPALSLPVWHSVSHLHWDLAAWGHGLPCCTFLALFGTPSQCLLPPPPTTLLNCLTTCHVYPSLYIYLCLCLCLCGACVFGMRAWLWAGSWLLYFWRWFVALAHGIKIQCMCGDHC